MSVDVKYILLDKRQSLAASLVSDGATFSLLALCIWISQGSRWWTFLTAVMFIAFAYAKAANVVDTRQHKFRSAEELRAWTDAELAKDHAA